MNGTHDVGTTKVPGWTVAIAAVFGVLGVAVSTLMVLDPAAAPFLSGFDLSEEYAPLAGGYAIRNSITALVLLIAVWLRTPSALFAAVSGRLLTELMDGTRTLAEGPDANLVIVVVLLVPAALVLFKLWPHVQLERTTARKTHRDETVGK
jgi:hypothetical protein